MEFQLYFVKANNMDLSVLINSKEIEGKFISDDPVSTSMNTIEDIEMLK